jgi:hypothetical protein
VLTAERATRFVVTPSTDPRDRLRAGCARDMLTAALLVKTGCNKEQAEIVAGCVQDRVTPPSGMTGTLLTTYRAADEAEFHWHQEHAEFVKRLTTRLTDAGLFDWAAALERGEYSALGW